MEELSGKMFEMPSNDTKSTLSEEDIKKLNIPQRDEVRYPMPLKDEIEDCGKFLWKTNLVASSLDGNLQALMWRLYSDISNYMKSEDDDLMPKVMISLYNLKRYIKESNNPLFKDDNKTI